MRTFIEEDFEVLFRHNTYENWTKYSADRYCACMSVDAKTTSTQTSQPPDVFLVSDLILAVLNN